MNVDYKAVGKRIKVARINAGMNQESLAELVYVSPTHLSNIETGTTRVSLQTLVRIANALSVSTDDLLCDSVIRATAQIQSDLAALLMDCNDYEIRIIADMTKALKETLRRDANLRRNSLG